MNPYTASLVIGLLALLGILVALVVPGIMLSMRSQKSESTGSTETSPEPTATAAKAAVAAPKKEEKKEAKKKKFELAFSYWLFLFLFIAAAFIVPPFMTEGLGSTDTWLLVLLSSLAATFAVSTAINYFFEFDETITKINKVVVAGLIAGFAWLLLQNGFSTTAALKDAGALASKPFGDINLNIPAAPRATGPQAAVMEVAVSSVTNPVRIDRPNNCRGFNLGKPVGRTVEIRYNGSGAWVTWSSGPTPRSERRVQFAELRLADSDGTVYMLFSCEAL